MIHLDTSVLIVAFSGRKSLAPRLRQLLDRGQRIHLSALVLFEWRRGPRFPEQIEAQEALFPSTDAVPFGSVEASVAADLCKKVKRPRGREIDLAIAACAIAHNAELWTVNPDDFKDVPDLKLLRLASPLSGPVFWGRGMRFLDQSPLQNRPGPGASICMARLPQETAADMSPAAID